MFVLVLWQSSEVVWAANDSRTKSRVGIDDRTTSRHSSMTEDNNTEHTPDEDLRKGKYFWMQSKTSVDDRSVVFNLSSVYYFEESMYGGTRVVLSNGHELNIILPFETFGNAFSTMIHESIIEITDVPSEVSN